MLKKKNVFVLVVLFILLGIIIMSTSCATKDTETGDSNKGDTRTEAIDGNETESAENVETAKLQPNLGAADFGGYVFRVLNRTTTSPDAIDWIPRDVYAEAMNGETINDAVYKRNAYLEDKYNFKISQIFWDSAEITKYIARIIQAGDDLFDVTYPNFANAPVLAQEGHFVNLHTIPNLDLSQPWWDQRANASLSIGGKLYFTSGDNAMVNKDACPAILFNKKLLAENELENPYVLVRNNQWTIGKLYDMCKGVAKDLNGDSKMNYTDDRYGFIGQRDSMTSFLHGAGELIAAKNTDDYPVITFAERAFKAMEGCFDLMYDQDVSHNAHHLEGIVPAIYEVSEKMFMEDRALFMWCRLRIVENLRSMETDFGILPIPKLDSAQTKWGHTVNRYVGVPMCVPITNKNLERTGHILEAICAESKYTTIPAYYDVALKTKFARDAESEVMLDIIFNSTVYDVGEIYNFGNFGYDLIFMCMKNDRNLASMFDKYLPKMEKDIEKVIEKYGELN